MADRIRRVVSKLKDKLHLTQITSQGGREKMDQLISKYVPANKVTEMAERLKNEAIGKKIKDLVASYEKFTGVEEIMALQNTVISAQDRFMQAQERRRDLGREVASIESRLKELHAEIQNTMKGDDKYLHLCTEEHKVRQFFEAEREERELFSSMAAAVKLGHERERAHAERNKYWYIIASIFGTALGIAGSTINNRLKMAEFRELMEQQMARSVSALYAVAGGAAAGNDIGDAMRSELAYQEQLAQNLKLMQENINHLVSKQSSLIDHINHQEHNVDHQLRELRKLILTASQNSAKSDAELAKVLSEVHHDLDQEQERELPTNRIVLEPNQIVTGIGIVMCMALLLGSALGKFS
ncbi:Coiled-coil domain-containing protein 51 [Eumeta japonica]|uniref:Coiled-coil domain-containing protein 51 n=1 Tax=Eumeta variegata TaxID=151549 RepID=A0A4C1UEQ5_EUMVA|nr:Coiled-coil domain-containing protein 51 [Eumeta japonica]